mmetsp:Transcript_14784/g.37218  ORF Transcript_14784/g.37218 Transcript_14784/m.37218 type:complete len:233 (+) Transcript_14784:519-1217(+)
MEFCKEFDTPDTRPVADHGGRPLWQRCHCDGKYGEWKDFELLVADCRPSHAKLFQPIFGLGPHERTRPASGTDCSKLVSKVAPEGAGHYGWQPGKIPALSKTQFDQTPVCHLHAGEALGCPERAAKVQGRLAPAQHYVFGLGRGRQNDSNGLCQSGDANYSESKARPAIPAGVRNLSGESSTKVLRVDAQSGTHLGGEDGGIVSTCFAARHLCTKYSRQNQFSSRETSPIVW